MPDDLVITGQNTNEVNIRVTGSRAALRNVDEDAAEYAVAVAGANPGRAIFEVEESMIQSDMPGGVQILSRSPASLEVTFERKGRKSVRIDADLEGKPAQGFTMGSVEVDPPRIWLAGARSEVYKLTAVQTETIDMTDATEDVERDVRLSLGDGHVWVEEDKKVKVRIPITPVFGPPPAPETAEPQETEG